MWTQTTRTQVTEIAKDQHDVALAEVNKTLCLEKNPLYTQNFYYLSSVTQKWFEMYKLAYQNRHEHKPGYRERKCSRRVIVSYVLC